jgi:hypothetical protein
MSMDRKIATQSRQLLATREPDETTEIPSALIAAIHKRPDRIRATARDCADQPQKQPSLPSTEISNKNHARTH